MVRESLVSNCFSGPLGRSLVLTSHHALQFLWLLSWWYGPTAEASGQSESRSLSFHTAGDFELAESVHARESWVHFIQTNHLAANVLAICLCWNIFIFTKRLSFFSFHFLDVADDYNHISGALNSTAADNNSAFKKWEVHFILLAIKKAWSKNSNNCFLH